MESSRKCRKCELEKPLSDFYKDRQEKNYLRQFKDCKKCSNKRNRKIYFESYQTKYRQKLSNKEQHRHQLNKQKAVDLFSNKCLDCNNSFPMQVYDFHHLDPTTKEKSPSQLWGHKWETIKQELDKCVMLCANCHRLRHFT